MKNTKFVPTNKNSRIDYIHFDSDGSNLTTDEIEYLRRQNSAMSEIEQRDPYYHQMNRIMKKVDLDLERKEEQEKKRNLEEIREKNRYKSSFSYNKSKQQSQEEKENRRKKQKLYREMKGIESILIPNQYYNGMIVVPKHWEYYSIEDLFPSDKEWKEIQNSIVPNHPSDDETPNFDLTSPDSDYKECLDYMNKVNNIEGSGSSSLYTLWQL